MKSLEKLSEALAVVGRKKGSHENLMGMIKSEWVGVENCEPELMLKNSKVVVESVKVSYELLNSKKRLLEEGLKTLDEKVKFVRGVLKEVEKGQVQSKITRDSMNQQLKELAFKEQQIQHLFETLELTLRHVQERKNEFDLMEKDLNGRNYEMDLRQKQLESRELEVCSGQQMLKKMQQELGAEKKRLEYELQSREASLVEREVLIASKERTLVERENDFGLKQKIWEKELMVKRETVIVSKELDVGLKEKLLEKRENLTQTKAMTDPREKFAQQPDSYTITKSPPGIHMEGNRRGLCGKSAGEDLAMDSQRRDGKRRCSGDGVTERIKPRPHPQQSGSKVKLEAAACSDLVIVEDSESDSDSLEIFASKPTDQPSSFSCGTEKVKQERKFNIGDVWCCFDSKDNLPRSLVQVISINNNKDGKDLLTVKWLKPCSVYDGEKAWIDAGLPVTCGKFNCSGVSIVSPRILSHLASFTGNGPWIIVPRIGETWAIYKDWDISTWSSDPKIHQNCKYDIVEILSYHHDGSSPCVRVANLNKILGSLNSFERIRYESECNSFLIKRTSFYSFSHRVPYVKKDRINVNGALHCIFELDQRSLPKGLV